LHSGLTDIQQIENPEKFAGHSFKIRRPERGTANFFDLLIMNPVLTDFVVLCKFGQL
jgi:hypothetical protein